MSRAHLHHSLPAASPHAGTSISQSKSHVLAGVQDAYWSDDEAEDAECPLCLEEMDISDLNFKPCVCGYQICRFCWHHIKENLNKKCPACRRMYTDDAVEFKPINTKDHKRLTQQKKQRERERKELDQLGRRHLVNVRVVQRNVVYIIGIGPRFAKEELIPTLRSHDYFGQYGKISKILIVKRTPSGGGAPVVGLYVTFHRKEDAARCIAAVDGSASPGGGREVMRASYGTTKYCMAFLRGASCNDQNCMNLHDWGDEKDCFTKEDLTTLKHTIKATESRTRTVTAKKGHESEVGLPRAASWAQKSASTHIPSSASGGPLTFSTRQSRRGLVSKQNRSSTFASSVGTETRVGQLRSQEPKPQSIVTQLPEPTVASTPPPSLPEHQSIEQPEKTQPSSSSSPILSVPTNSDEDALENVQVQPPVEPSIPPGLSLIPPGLPAPPGITTSARPPRTESASPQTPLLSSSSSYQMSTAARALLDDVKARREFVDPQTAPLSPFPDLDRTLQSLAHNDNGGFSFNLDPSLVGEEESGLATDFSYNPNAPFNGSYLDAFPALRTANASHPPLMYPPGLHHISMPLPVFTDTLRHTISGRESQLPSPNSYMGSFNPFAETAEDRTESLTSSPALANRSQTDDEMGRGVSRFGFARGKQTTGKSALRQMNTSHGPLGSPAAKMQASKLADTPSPFVQGIAPHMSAQVEDLHHPTVFGGDVTESQLRDFIQSSKERAMLSHAIPDPHKTMPYATQFRDPAIISAPFITSHGNEIYNQGLVHGPPPGLAFPPLKQESSGGPNTSDPAMNNVSTPPSPNLSPVFSASDFPALQPSLAIDIGSRDMTSMPKVTPAIKNLEQAQKKIAKISPTTDSAPERMKATSKSTERPKIDKVKSADVVRVVDHVKLKDLPEKTANEARRQPQKDRSIQPKVKNQSVSKDKLPNKEGDKPSLRVETLPVMDESAIQVPLLSKKPKKNKPNVKPSKSTKDGSGHDDTLGTPSTTGVEATLLPSSHDKATSTSDLALLDYDLPTPICDLLDEIHISNPSLDFPNHPFFDLQKLHPTASMPLEYGPLVHALSALSVGGGSFSHNMPSGSIDNAVSSFQQLLETLTQTISDLLRLLPRTTWDDSSSFDGVLRDMLKGDDFLDDGGEDTNTKDEVAALTQALERRARWMEVQLSKLEELHRDINTAAVRAILAFNDNGWDRHGFLPRTGNTLRKFDNLGVMEEHGKVRTMNSNELQERLEVAKDAALLAETELREAMEQLQSIKPVGTEVF